MLDEAVDAAFVAIDDRKLPKPAADKPAKPVRQVVQAVLPPASSPPSVASTATPTSPPPPSSFSGGGSPARLGELFVRENLITLGQLQEAQNAQKQEGGTLGFHLTNLGFVESSRLIKFLSKQYGVPAINLDEFEIDAAVIRLLAKEVAEKHQVVPVNRAGGSLIVAMTDPSNIFAIDDIKFLTGYNIEVVVTSEQAVQAAIQKYYERDLSVDRLHSFDFDDVIGGFEEEVDFAEGEVDENENEVGDDDDDRLLLPAPADEPVVDLTRAGADAPVVKLVNLILVDALKKNATLILLCATKYEATVKYRIDGELHDVMKPPLKVWPAMLERLREMAQMSTTATSGSIALRVANQRPMRFDIVVMKDGDLAISVDA